VPVDPASLYHYRQSTLRSPPPHLAARISAKARKQPVFNLEVNYTAMYQPDQSSLYMSGGTLIWYYSLSPYRSMTFRPDRETLMQAMLDYFPS
jgi:hypothetical protein